MAYARLVAPVVSGTGISLLMVLRVTSNGQIVTATNTLVIGFAKFTNLLVPKGVGTIKAWADFSIPKIRAGRTGQMQARLTAPEFLENYIHETWRR